VRGFADPDVVHVDGVVNPKSDMETINTELILADLQTIEKAHSRIEKEVKAKKKDPTWKPNPRRCEEQRERVLALEGQNKVWLERFDHVDDSLLDIQSGLKTLMGLHLKP
jgi:ribosome-binding ATPase YchF (GTP1/OBG family)